MSIYSQTCTICGHTAPTPEAVIADFGLRCGGRYAQPQCSTCRRTKRHANVWDIAPSLTLGVEVEWSGGLNRANAANAVAAAFLNAGFEDVRYNGMATVAVRTARGVQKFEFVHDGSVPYGGEMVTPILTLADMDILQTAVRALRAAGAETSRDRAGIHVHVGAQDLTIDQVRNLARYTYAWEDHIKAGVNTHPTRAHWCREVQTVFVERLDKKPKGWTRNDLDAAWYDTHGGHHGKERKYHSSRYRGLNLHALFTKGTIEFRYFDGTLHAGKIRAYVEMCVGLVARAKAAKKASSKRVAFDRSSPEAVEKSMAAFYKFLELGRAHKTCRTHLTRNALAATRIV